jgi:hypothetical protein
VQAQGVYFEGWINKIKLFFGTSLITLLSDLVYLAKNSWQIYKPSFSYRWTDWHTILQFYHCHNCELVASEWCLFIYITLHLINCACMRFHVLTAVTIVITAFWDCHHAA